MSPFALNLEKTHVETKPVAVEPAINAFNSMVVISKAKDDPGFHEWVSKTREQMSAEELQHQLENCFSSKAIMSLFMCSSNIVPLFNE